MKLRYCIPLLFMMLAASLAPRQSRADDDAAARLSKSLTLDINSERTSNIFTDSETMNTHKPILLSWRVASAIPGTSKVEVRWRLLDADGKKVFDGSHKYNIEEGNYAAGRQLFSPKKRGAYLWTVRTVIKLDGKDLEKTASMPFAVIAEPRPAANPFLSVDSSDISDPVTADFYRRLGIPAYLTPVSISVPFPVPGSAVNPAARRRVIWFARSQAKGAVFAMGDANNSDQDISPRESATALVQNTVMAYGGNASGYTVSLNPEKNGSISFSSPSDDIDQLIPWERASAYAATGNLLGGAQFVKELFAGTPAVYASLFQSGNTSLAAIWSNQDNKGHLKLKLPGAILLDVNGNQVDTANKSGDLKIPLTNDLYYVSVNNSPEALARALRAAAIDGMASVRAQVLPMTQISAGGTARQLQVRLQNITPHACSGIVSLDAPEGWKLEHNAQQFVLQPGQWRVYDFAVAEAKAFYSQQMRVKVRVNNGVTGNWSWHVEPPIATADNWTEKSTFALDGSLDDWKDAAWMKAGNPRANRKAAVAVRWDNRNLYIAAKVEEPRFTARQDENGEYHFWNGDAIQLGFGWREEAWMKPAAANFRDTDYGFVLAPFTQNENGSIEARVLLLWNPTTPFGNARDKVRWGGAVNGADCRIVFNSKKKEAVYEAIIPLAALGNLDPLARVATATAPDQPIRFSWIAHTFDGADVQWSEAAGVFPWWGNAGSFLPAQNGYLAAQTLLGFSQQGEVMDAGDTVSKKTDTSDTSLPLPPMPSQQQVPPMNPSPPQNQVPSLPNPVPVQPIPPNLLPPAPPES